MEIARNATFEDGKLILEGLADEKLTKVIGKRLGIDALIEDNRLVIFVNSRNEAIETYREIAKLIIHTHHLKRLGFRFCEIFGYRFLIYLREYEDEIENEILNNPLSEDFDIVTLPNQNGYYYSTLYGIDNINIPVLLTIGNLFAKELAELVENNPSLPEFLELKEISKNVLRLERLGDTTLARLARNFEKIASLEETLTKIIAVRHAVSCELAIAGNIEHAEIQKIRRLGNGLCVYLSKTLRDRLDIKEGDAVSVRVLAGKIFIEKV